MIFFFVKFIPQFIKLHVFFSFYQISSILCIQFLSNLDLRENLFWTKIFAPKSKTHAGKEKFLKL